MGIENISPIDGRYSNQTAPLSEFFSEKGLIKYRIKVEIEYLIALSEHPQIGTRSFSQEEKTVLRNLCDITAEEAGIVKLIETKGYGSIKATKHDVKAIEYFIKDKVKGTTLDDSLEWIHFALTSEDVNSIAYGLMLSDGLSKVIIPSAKKLYQTIEDLAQTYKDSPLLARTHGQPASPTTFGKEFKVFSSRLKRKINQLRKCNSLVKLNGATGNYNAQHIAYPNVNWIEFTRDFVERFNDGRRIKLKPNLITTQIESADAYAELFNSMCELNNMVLGFNRDIWDYISRELIKQKPVAGEVGSSTMPHKINPIDFENSEGNLGVANALFSYFSSKLPVSRLQRDLSDSTVKRNFGVPFGHSLIAYESTLKGLGKLDVDEQKAIEELENHPEVISEAIQTVLRREGAKMPYEQLKKLTRGREVTLVDFKTFIESLEVSDAVKEELRQITPTNYTGLACLLVETQ